MSGFSNMVNKIQKWQKNILKEDSFIDVWRCSLPFRTDYGQTMRNDFSRNVAGVGCIVFFFSSNTIYHGQIVIRLLEGLFHVVQRKEGVQFLLQFTLQFGSEEYARVLDEHLCCEKDPPPVKKTA